MKKLITLFCFALSFLSFTSCGLMEMDDEFAMNVMEMHLDRDTLYAMKGETFALSPVFTPDGVALNDIYWTIDDEAVISIDNNVFTAVDEGWTTIHGMSVMNQVEDSCHVCVLSDWEHEVPTFPYETVFYADVKVGGMDFNPNDMVLGAFIDDDLCGVGKMYEAHGVKYMQIRVGSEFLDDSGSTTQSICFMLYNRRMHTCSTFVTEELEFDGNTHGTLSNLFSLRMD